MSVPLLYSVGLSEWLDIGLNAGAYGGAIYTANNGRSTYHTVVGDLVRDEQEFKMSGMRGKFVEFHGLAGRQIVWTGHLRLAEAALTTVIAQRDEFRAASGVFTFTDDDGSSYENCRILAFELHEKQRCQVPGASLAWFIPYMILLEQIVI